MKMTVDDARRMALNHLKELEKGTGCELTLQSTAEAVA
jgi:hypothetical protein